MRVGDQADIDRLAALGLSGLAVTVPLATSAILTRAHPGAFDSTEWTAVDVFDLALAVLLGIWLYRGGPRRLFRQGSRNQRVIAIGAAAVVLVSLAVHPSWHGLEMLLRGVGAVATVDAAHQLGRQHRRWFLTSLLCGGLFQAVLGVAQSINGEKFAIQVLEYKYRLFPFGGDVAGQGSFFHPYLLAAYLVVALGAALVLTIDRIGEWYPTIAATVIAAGVATTFSRSALLGAGLATLVLLWVGLRRRRGLVFGIALCAGVGIGGVIGFDGWMSRAESSASTASVDTNRRDHLRDGLRLVERSPIVGVGLGRYGTELRDVPHEQLVHSHNPVVQVAAETGVVGGLLTAILLVAGAAWAMRAGPVSAVIALMQAPFWFIDAYGVVFPVGVAVAGLWMAVIVVGGRRSRDAVEPEAVLAHAPS